MDINALIDFHRYPLETCRFYHGDVTRDTLQVLENVRDMGIDEEGLRDVMPEILAQLPAEDELCDIIDTLTDSLEMNKPEMIDQIKKVLLMLEDKQMQLFQQSDYAREIAS